MRLRYYPSRVHARANPIGFRRFADTLPCRHSTGGTSAKTNTNCVGFGRPRKRAHRSKTTGLGSNIGDYIYTEDQTTHTHTHTQTSGYPADVPEKAVHVIAVLAANISPLNPVLLGVVFLALSHTLVRRDESNGKAGPDGMDHRRGGFFYASTRVRQRATSRVKAM